MNVIDVRDTVSRNAKADISLEQAKALLFTINSIIYEQSAQEAALDVELQGDDGINNIRSYGYRRIAEVLGIEL
jgi:hypothetical protein